MEKLQAAIEIARKKREAEQGIPDDAPAVPAADHSPSPSPRPGWMRCGNPCRKCTSTARR